MARRPWEPGPAAQAKPRHRGPSGSVPHLPAGSRMGVAPGSGFPISISEASLGPACQPPGTTRAGLRPRGRSRAEPLGPVGSA